jgi:hypothetical protein
MPPKFDPKYNGPHSTPRTTPEKKAAKAGTGEGKESAPAPAQTTPPKKWKKIVQKTKYLTLGMSTDGGMINTKDSCTVFSGGKAYVYKGPNLAIQCVDWTPTGPKTTINGLSVEEWARASGCQEFTLEQFCEKHPEFSLT